MPLSGPFLQAGRGSQVSLFFLLHDSYSWVKTKLHTETQLPRLPGSALKFHVGGQVGWVPTHYQVTLNSC